MCSQDSDMDSSRIKNIYFLRTKQGYINSIGDMPALGGMQKPKK